MFTRHNSLPPASPARRRMEGFASLPFRRQLKAVKDALSSQEFDSPMLRQFLTLYDPVSAYESLLPHHPSLKSSGLLDLVTTNLEGHPAIFLAFVRLLALVGKLLVLSSIEVNVIEGYEEELYAAEVVDTTFSIMEAHPDNASVQVSCLKALTNLTHDGIYSHFLSLSSHARYSRVELDRGGARGYRI